MAPLQHAKLVGGQRREAGVACIPWVDQCCGGAGSVRSRENWCCRISTLEMGGCILGDSGRECHKISSGTGESGGRGVTF